MSRVNESCHICMSRVAYEYVMRAWVIHIYMYGAYIVGIPEVCTYVYIHMYISNEFTTRKTHGAHMGLTQRGGGLGSRPKKMYGERLGDGVEYHLMSPTPRRYVPFTTGRRAH